MSYILNYYSYLFRSSDHSPVFEYPALSDEFRKKLEEWRQIKASGRPMTYAEHKKLQDKTPSPKLSRYY